MTIRDILFSDHIKRDQEWIVAAKQLYEVQLILKEGERKQRMLSAYLKDISEQKSSKGGDFIYTCSARKGNVDYSSIPAIKTIDLEQYRTDTIQAWKLQRI